MSEAAYQMSREAESAKAWADNARLDEAGWSASGAMYRQDVIKVLVLRYQSLRTSACTFTGIGATEAAAEIRIQAEAFAAAIQLLEASK